MAIRKRSWKNKGGDQAAWVYDWSDHSGRRHRQQFKTQGEAKAHRTEIENQLRTGAFRPEGRKVTVRDLAAEYVKHLEARNLRDERMTTYTVVMLKARIRNYILAQKGQPTAQGATKFDDGIGSVRLFELTPRSIGQFRDRLRDAGMSVANTRQILNTLRGMFKFAVANNYIAINPARGIAVIGPRSEEPKKVEPPSKDLVRALLGVADENFKVALKIAAFTGVRAGEQRALRWRHFDFATKTVSIVTRVDRYGDEGPPKSAAGVRSIPLSEALTAELLALRERSQFHQDADLVFPRADGGYTEHSNLMTARFRPLFKKLEQQRLLVSSLPVPVYFKWHALRHFAVSCWIEAGLSIKMIQTLAGHASIQMTMDTYGHMFPSEEPRIAIEKISQSFL